MGTSYGFFALDYLNVLYLLRCDFRIEINGGPDRFQGLFDVLIVINGCTEGSIVHPSSQQTRSPQAYVR